MRRIADERGGATVFAACAMCGLLVVALLIVQFGAAVSARHNAQSAADLAALAAAGELDRGDEAACTAASAVADRMHVRVRSCEVQSWDAVVTVVGRVLLSTFGAKDVVAVARAGPVDE
ncbi:Rv3654c family TadE-like protein [Antrihabitans cavernicola]|uniref:Flp pilus-assembly TadE/G-like family protein n=1 Tax=Antrihabitans cavernicola TaxID=2495913 RepID=A0A5A7SI91_9NOCA|nr:Rv3654c family TadE-like protein [Spelaeibacter cavernicola]KAA0024447.1 flp pilus-assembly TadE/G-like family protein [Spelaeibacter cavernicola]